MMILVACRIPYSKKMSWVSNFVTLHQRTIRMIRTVSSFLAHHGYALASCSMAMCQLHWCICGYHIYRDEWDTAVGKELEWRKTIWQTFMLLLLCKTALVGHLSQKILRMCALFIKRRGTIWLYLATFTFCSGQKKEHALRFLCSSLAHFLVYLFQNCCWHTLQ